MKAQIAPRLLFKAKETFPLPLTMPPKGQENLLLHRGWFKWSLITFLTTINFILTYSFSNVSLNYIYYYLSDLFLTYLDIQFFVLAVRILDNSHPWTKSIRKRLLLQFGLLTPVIMGFIVINNEVLEALIPTGRITLSFYSFDLIVIFVLVLLVQLLYMCTWFIQRANRQKVSNELSLKVTQGLSLRHLKASEISAIGVNNQMTYVYDKSGNKYMSNETLAKLEEVLPEGFFRANRQFLLTREAVMDFKSDSYGKIAVRMHPVNGNSEPELMISRGKAAAFRKWIKEE